MHELLGKIDPDNGPWRSLVLRQRMRYLVWSDQSLMYQRLDTTLACVNTQNPPVGGQSLIGWGLAESQHFSTLSLSHLILAKNDTRRGA